MEERFPIEGPELKNLSRGLEDGIVSQLKMQAFEEVGRARPASGGKGPWLRGLDLNQRPSGYER